jgi:hypothetical protein
MEGVYGFMEDVEQKRKGVYFILDREFQIV